MMLRRYVLVFGLVALGLVLNGCTKCGPIWDDWLQAPKSCKSDRLEGRAVPAVATRLRQG
jgi:hypothetical protein